MVVFASKETLFEFGSASINSAGEIAGPGERVFPGFRAVFRIATMGRSYRECVDLATGF
jgi:hypothetical protein